MLAEVCRLVALLAGLLVSAGSFSPRVLGARLWLVTPFCCARSVLERVAAAEGGRFAGGGLTEACGRVETGGDGRGGGMVGRRGYAIFESSLGVLRVADKLVAF